MRKRVPPINARGVFKGNGFLSIANGALRVRGRRVPSPVIRWALGIAWYLGLVLVVGYAVLLVYPDGLSGQTGLSIPIIVLAYLAANYFVWVSEDFEVPLSSIRAVASDPARHLLALSISAHPRATPIVMLVDNPSLIGKALSELKSNAGTIPVEGAQPLAQADASPAALTRRPLGAA